MLILKFKPLTDIFDAVEEFWETPSTQRKISFFLFWLYLLALAAIECNRRGFLPSPLSTLTPHSHFAAIQMAFTLILAMEVLGLIISIPSSFSKSVGKQFEILALILLRNAFKELSHLPEPVNIANHLLPILHICSSAAGALIIFVILGFYFLIKSRQNYITSELCRTRYILSKKLLALSLLIIFFCVGARDIFINLTQATEVTFFETIYTVLIFADIALVLLSQRFMPSFHAVFRNSGFVVGTLLMRLSLSTGHPWDTAVSLFSALYILALTYAINVFTPPTMKEEESRPKNSHKATPSE